VPVTIPPSDYSPTPVPHRVRWTREQCRLMQAEGILIGRYELADGQIVSKIGQNPPHAYVIRALMAWLVRLFGEDYVQVQLPIHIVGEDAEHNDPEPDCAVLALPARQFADHHRLPSELRLVIEVADMTLEFDLKTKARGYGKDVQERSTNALCKCRSDPHQGNNEYCPSRLSCRHRIGSTAIS